MPNYFQTDWVILCSFSGQQQFYNKIVVLLAQWKMNCIPKVRHKTFGVQFINRTKVSFFRHTLSNSEYRTMSCIFQIILVPRCYRLTIKDIVYVTATQMAAIRSYDYICYFHIMVSFLNSFPCSTQWRYHGQANCYYFQLYGYANLKCGLLVTEERPLS